MTTKFDPEIVAELQEKYGKQKVSTLLAYLDLVLVRNEHINLTFSNHSPNLLVSSERS